MNVSGPKLLLFCWMAAALCGCRPFTGGEQPLLPISFYGSGDTKAFIPSVRVDEFSVTAFTDAASIPSVFLDGEHYPFDRERYWPQTDSGQVPRIDFIGFSPAGMHTDRSYSGADVIERLVLEPGMDEDILYFHTGWVRKQSPVHVTFRHVFNRLRRISFSALDPSAGTVQPQRMVMTDYVSRAALVLKAGSEDGSGDMWQVEDRCGKILLDAPCHVTVDANLNIVPGRYHFLLAYSIEKYGRSKEYSKEFDLDLGSLTAKSGGTIYDVALHLGDDIVMANPVKIACDDSWDGTCTLTEDFWNPFRLWIMGSGNAWQASAYPDLIARVIDRVLRENGREPMTEHDAAMLKDALQNSCYPVMIPAYYGSVAGAESFAAGVDALLAGPPMYISPEFDYEVLRESDPLY